ncbi:MAG: HAD hydrolase-like protein [Edaphobacter sp.]|uniref:HAD family hydrolase n=1 Tax=Edaphobacter sp. TaxID=1934404 RepID=UPI0023859DAF|nr:HAD family hydrolase [Edaphobacter sp.]MDE1175460.1 HAD hydrolase-like protein [Edaphobacter sp.]
MNFPLTRTLPQTLLIDADDTLWENNVYFERAIAGFISYLDHKVHTPAEVREHLNHCEHRTIAARGYGLVSFRQSLADCFAELSSETVTGEQRAQIDRFADIIHEHDIELLPTVGDTLAELARRHRLVLVTKGDSAEQTGKLKRSGLERHFAGVEVLPEKHPEAYLELTERHLFERERTWMIGNSPRSDINPALSAGLHAVFIPHEFTWVLEHETVQVAPAGQQLLQLSRFGDLLDHF